MSKKSQSDESGSRLSDYVYQALMDRILSGRFRSGDVIAEKTLAEELGVSRTPVHVALRELVKDGFLTQQKNRRPVVAELSADDVSELFDMRALLEGEAAALAAEKMDRATLESLQASGEKLKAIDSFDALVEKWVSYEDEFHGAIAEASGNKRLAKNIRHFRLSHRAFVINVLDPQYIKEGLKEHLGVLDAIEKKDSEKSRDRMNAHIKKWQPYFIRVRPKSLSV